MAIYCASISVSQFVCKMDKLLIWTPPQNNEAYLISCIDNVIIATGIKRAESVQRRNCCSIFVSGGSETENGDDL